MKTRLFYAEQILLSLQDANRNRDEKFDVREVYPIMDNIVNALAKQGFFENWKFGFGGIDDLFTTTFEWITPTDPANSSPSYFSLPVTSYVTLPKNQGIQDIYFQNDFTTVKKKYFAPVIITSFKDQSSFRSSMANGLQGRISCYIKNGVIYFDRGNINKVYGNIGLRLAVRDSSQILDNAPYPIPAEHEKTVIDQCVLFFRSRRDQGADLVRDQNDSKTVTK